MLRLHPTLILRHKRENRKKCSLRGLENREGFQFFSYPLQVKLPSLEKYLVLSLDGEPLTRTDNDKGLFLIDGTWRYSEKMLKSLPPGFETRSLPSYFVTAYPRKQEDCKDPQRGLASIEALFLAFHILGRKTENLLDHYHWKEEFIRRNGLQDSLPTLE